MPELYTAVDMGSNSFRLLSAIKNNKKPYYKIKTMIKETPRISRGFSNKNIFTEDAMERAVKSLKIFLPYIRKSKQSKIVATGVFREATNIRSFFDKIKPLGINIAVLTTEKEAELSGLGAINEIPYTIPKVLYIDIGGGSFEIAFFENNKMSYFFSTPMGAVKSMELFNIYYKYNTTNIINLKNYLDEKLNKIYNNIKGKDFTVILSGGTVSTLIMMEKKLDLYNRDELNGVIVELPLINKWIEVIANTPVENRKYIRGLEDGREDIIFTGLLILKNFFQVFSINKGINSEGGLLEGTLLTLINKEV